MKRNLFTAHDGDLIDLDTLKVVREKFQYHFRQIEDTYQLRSTLRAGEYAWPGGTRLAFTTRDGAHLSFASVRKNYRLISDSIRTRYDDGWWVVGCDTLDDEYPIHCDDTGELLNSYGEEE